MAFLLARVFLPSLARVVSGLVQLAPNYPARFVGLYGCFVSGLADFASRGVGIAMTFFFGLLRTARAYRCDASDNKDGNYVSRIHACRNRCDLNRSAGLPLGKPRL